MRWRFRKKEKEEPDQSELILRAQAEIKAAKKEYDRLHRKNLKLQDQLSCLKDELKKERAEHRTARTELVSLRKRNAELTKTCAYYIRTYTSITKKLDVDVTDKEIKVPKNP